MNEQIKRALWMKTGLGPALETARSLPHAVHALAAGKRVIAAEPAAAKVFSGAHGDVRYVVTGRYESVTVVFIHGSPGRWEAWGSYLEKPRPGYVCLAPDRLGYGGSRAGVAISSIDRQAEAIAELVQSTTVGPIVVVGHSHGGPVAVRVATRLGERAKGLLLLAANLEPRLEGHDWFQSLALAPARKGFLPSSLRVSLLETEPLRRELEHLRRDFKNLKCRVIALHGRSDSIVDRRHVDIVEREIPGAIVERIEGVDHSLPFTRPDLVWDAIERLSQSDQ